MRPLLGLLLPTCLALAACGSSGGSASPTNTPDPNATRTATNTRKPTRTPTRTGGPTRTPTRTGGPTYTPRPTRTPGPPVTLFVRESGNDENAGTAPDQALRTLEAALERLSPGSTIYVGRGVYRERLTVTNVAATADLPARILADRTGQQTGDPAGDVVLDGNGNLVAAIVTSSPYVTIDGFVIRGVAPTDTASAVGVRVRGGSDHVAIRNCVIANAQPADGIRVDSSSDVLLFNNLIYSADRGVVITGAANRVQLINNTVALSQRAALSLRASGGSAPAGTTVTNSIFQENGSGAAIDATGAGSGWDGDFNLVFQPAPRGPDRGLQSADAARRPRPQRRRALRQHRRRRRAPRIGQPRDRRRHRPHRRRPEDGAGGALDDRGRWRPRPDAARSRVPLPALRVSRARRAARRGRRARR